MFETATKICWSKLNTNISTALDQQKCLFAHQKFTYHFEKGKVLTNESLFESVSSNNDFLKCKGPMLNIIRVLFYFTNLK